MLFIICDFFESVTFLQFYVFFYEYLIVVVFCGDFCLPKF